jgi:hypothetical protein
MSQEWNGIPIEVRIVIVFCLLLIASWVGYRIWESARHVSSSIPKGFSGQLGTGKDLFGGEEPLVDTDWKTGAQNTEERVDRFLRTQPKLQEYYAAGHMTYTKHSVGKKKKHTT